MLTIGTGKKCYHIKLFLVLNLHCNWYLRLIKISSPSFRIFSFSCSLPPSLPHSCFPSQLARNIYKKLRGPLSYVKDLFDALDTDESQDLLWAGITLTDTTTSTTLVLNTPTARLFPTVPTTSIIPLIPQIAEFQQAVQTRFPQMSYLVDEHAFQVLSIRTNPTSPTLLTLLPFLPFLALIISPPAILPG